MELLGQAEGMAGGSWSGCPGKVGPICVLRALTTNHLSWVPRGRSCKYKPEWLAILQWNLIHSWHFMIANTTQSKEVSGPGTPPLDQSLAACSCMVVTSVPCLVPPVPHSLTWPSGLISDLPHHFRPSGWSHLSLQIFFDFDLLLEFWKFPSKGKCSQNVKLYPQLCYPSVHIDTHITDTFLGSCTQWSHSYRWSSYIEYNTISHLRGTVTLKELAPVWRSLHIKETTHFFPSFL